MRINEELLAQQAKYQQGYEEFMRQAKEQESQRQKAMESMGLNTEDMSSAFQVQKDTPQLVNISDDPSLSGALLYFLDVGSHRLGSHESCKPRLHGLGMKLFMCEILNEDNEVLTLTPLKADGSNVDVDGAGKIGGGCCGDGSGHGKW